METDNITPVITETAVMKDDKNISNQDQPVIDDEAILDMAKRRLAIKRNLTGQAMDYLLILLCLVMMVFAYYAESRLLIGFVFSLFWGIRLLYRIIKFAQPSFKDGISAYIKMRNEERIESEFNRLKKVYRNNS